MNLTLIIIKLTYNLNIINIQYKYIYNNYNVIIYSCNEVECQNSS